MDNVGTWTHFKRSTTSGLSFKSTWAWCWLKAHMRGWRIHISNLFHFGTVVFRHLARSVLQFQKPKREELPIARIHTYHPIIDIQRIFDYLKTRATWLKHTVENWQSLSIVLTSTPQKIIVQANIFMCSFRIGGEPCTADINRPVTSNSGSAADWASSRTIYIIDQGVTRPI